jgi:hypothetical protein
MFPDRARKNLSASLSHFSPKNLRSLILAQLLLFHPTPLALGVLENWIPTIAPAAGKIANPNRSHQQIPIASLRLDKEFCGRENSGYFSVKIATNQQRQTLQIVKLLTSFFLSIFIIDAQHFTNDL